MTLTADRLGRRSVLTAMASLPLLASGRVLAAESRGAAAIGPNFQRVAGAQPILRPDPSAVFHCPMRDAPIRWRALHTFNPAAIVMDDAVYVMFRAEDDTGIMKVGGHTSRLGLARSVDGLTFEALRSPVLFPAEDDQREAEWDGGCEDPRLAARDDGTFVCTYTQFNRRTTRIGVATSRDLMFWHKHGSAFAGTSYEDFRTKSAAVVHEVRDGRMVAARLNGRYWMLFGEGAIHAAHSDDLIRWTPLEASPGVLKVVMGPRKGRFDSSLAEVGPPPILTETGIVVLYNGRNAREGGDRSRSPFEYAGGMAVLDPADLTHVLSRADEPFFSPALPWERTGQYQAGTTFIEGLVPFRGEWFLYYGSADSLVGVARARAV
jgi:predicted GH43/DUF377 family glycosyl hydrolase